MNTERRRLAVVPDRPSGVTALFAGHGRPSLAADGRSFLLDRANVYLVEEGQVDIFSVGVEGGRPVGSRTHLLRVTRGGVFLDIAAHPSPGGRTLLAVGHVGTRLAEIPQARLWELLAGAELTAVVRTLLDSWIDAVCGGLAPSLVPKRCVELEIGVPHAMPAGTMWRPRGGVAWITHADAPAYLFGRPELAIDGHVHTPLSGLVWLTSPQTDRVTTFETAAVEPEALWRGLLRLHALVLQWTDLLARDAHAADSARLQEKTAFQKSLLKSACARLVEAAIPSGKRAEPSWLAVADDGPMRTWRLVAQALGLRFKPAAALTSAAVAANPVDAMLRAVGSRARRVMLRHDWWRHDAGPLLGFRDGSRPVALLPTARGYVIDDPERSVVEPVGRADAASLVPFAYSFYRPFPDGVLGPMKVLRFGIDGCGHDVATLIAAGVAGAALGLIPPVVVGMLFNATIPGAERSQLLELTIVLLAVAMAAALFNIAQGLLFLRIEARMGGSVQAAVWDRLLKLPLSFFRPYTAGDLAVRAMSIDAIRQIVSGSTMTALMGGVWSLGNVGLMFYYSANLAWRAILIILGVVVVALIGGWLQLRPQREAILAQAKASGIVLQLLTSISKIRVAGVEAAAFARWVERFSTQRRVQCAVRTIGTYVAAFNGAVPVVGTLLIFWIALPLLSHDRLMRTGDFVAFLSAYSSCISALLGTCAALLAAGNAIPLYEHARPILETLPEVDVRKADPGTLSGDIEVQHALFRYAADGPLVLHDVSFRVGPGEFVALVGPSGSGKSTLLRLLLGFETLESGAIYYDEQALDGLDIQAVRRQIGVVLQSGRLMSGDIFTNVVGSSSATLDDAWAAARMAGFGEDIEAMPMGMHTVISEGGSTLSGGQRQRILIARAIVHRPRILLFDEATSALDNRTQAIVADSLDRLQATRIVVAHRLSTIMSADRICVLDHGRIVQNGTYRDLIAKRGLFADLARRQIARGHGAGWGGAS